jgi:hypothetical protein
MLGAINAGRIPKASKMFYNNSRSDKSRPLWQGGLSYGELVPHNVLVGLVKCLKFSFLVGRLRRSPTDRSSVEIARRQKEVSKFLGRRKQTTKK